MPRRVRDSLQHRAATLSRLHLQGPNNTLAIAVDAEVLVVHVLGSEQFRLARHGGELTGDSVDEFAACSWGPGPGGAPVPVDCAPMDNLDASSAVRTLGQVTTPRAGLLR